MQAFRMSRVTGNTCCVENDLENSKEVDVPANSGDVATVVKISTDMPSKCSKTLNSGTSTVRHQVDIVPDCFPEFCSWCFARGKGSGSNCKAISIFRGKTLSIIEHIYFDAFILVVIFISSVSLVSYCRCYSKTRQVT